MFSETLFSLDCFHLNSSQQAINSSAHLKQNNHFHLTVIILYEVTLLINQFAI